MPVSIEVVPPAATQVYAVEDGPPTGWTVSNIDSGGVFDTGTGTVKWGPFFDNQSRTLGYEVTPPAGTPVIRRRIPESSCAVPHRFHRVRIRSRSGGEEMLNSVDMTTLF